MSRPQVTAATEAFYARLPQVYRDADERADAGPADANGHPLLRYLSLLLDATGEVFDVADELASGALTDPWRARARWLPFLAAFAGIDASRYPADTSLEDPDEPLRAAIAGAPDARRPGSEAAILGAVRPLLAGTRAAEITSRDVAALTYTITVYEAQVRDRAALEALVRASAPAGLLGRLEVLGGWLWVDLEDTGWSWDELAGPEDAPRTWDDVAAMVPASAGLSTWAALSRRTWDEIAAAGLTWTTLPRS